MAASVAENLDLLTEILLRLPARSLLRFKCVSKQWGTLISDQRFCHLYALRQCSNRYPFPCSLLLAPTPLKNPTCPRIHFTSSGNEQFTSMVSDFSFLNFPFISIKHSCNGLLLVEGKKWQQRRDYNSIFFVCNLTTKQFVPIFLPSLTFTRALDAIFLDFDPLRSLHFKVVSLRCGDFPSSGDIFNLEIPTFRGDPNTKYEIKVYSSETRSWSDPGFCFSVSKYMDMTSGVYCNGAIYWRIKAENSFYFDVQNQCFKTYPMPSSIDKLRVKVRYFDESAGHLYLILDSFDNPTQLGFDILELKEDCSGWSLRFHVDLNPIRVEFPGLNFNSFQQFDVLCFVCREKEEDSMLVLFINGGVMSYNLVDYTFRKLGHFKRAYGHTTEVFQYFENLFWVGASKSLKRSRRNR